MYDVTDLLFPLAATSFIPLVCLGILHFQLGCCSHKKSRSQVSESSTEDVMPVFLKELREMKFVELSQERLNELSKIFMEHELNDKC